MKAQRRHELRTNQLAKSLETFPEKLYRHANKIIFGLLIIILIVLLVRYRINTAENRHEEAQSDMANVQNALAALQQEPPDEARQFQLEHAVLDKLDSIDGIDSDMPDVAARALVARGDANLTLANGVYAGVEPPDHPETADDYLNAADDAYSEVIEKYSDQLLPMLTARFGLAAIDQDRHQWDEAKSQYQAVINDPNAGEVFKAYAKDQIINITQFAKPIYVGEPSLNLPTPSATTQPFGPPAPLQQPSTTRQTAVTPLIHATTRPTTR
ncbi:MAG TPA: hypothetical protein VMD30_03550 [Tepidisphaeraceae bacterium]|nr:hypothetical protein [Tepidisphaeraceae bacterium]